VLFNDSVEIERKRRAVEAGDQAELNRINMSNKLKQRELDNELAAELKRIDRDYQIKTRAIQQQYKFDEEILQLERNKARKAAGISKFSEFGTGIVKGINSLKAGFKSIFGIGDQAAEKTASQKQGGAGGRTRLCVAMMVVLVIFVIALVAFLVVDLPELRYLAIGSGVVYLGLFAFEKLRSHQEGPPTEQPK
jgi:hypothetical protein